MKMKELNLVNDIANEKRKQVAMYNIDTLLGARKTLSDNLVRHNNSSCSEYYKNLDEAFIAAIAEEAKVLTGR